MSKIDLTITFEEDKLDALAHFLKKKGTTPLKELAKTLDAIYEQAVPKDVREYIESRGAPAPRNRPKPAPKTAEVAKDEEQRTGTGTADVTEGQ